MTTSKNDLSVPPWVATLAPYRPGLPVDELAASVGRRKLVVLANNESPWGPPPAAREALLHPPALELYPEGDALSLRRELGRQEGLDADHVVAGAGSCEVLHMLCRALLAPGDEAVAAADAFIMLQVLVRAAGATPVLTAPPRDHGHDVDALLAAVTPRTRLLYVANPNNPTGAWLARGQLARLLESVPPRITVVIDEAYVEYADADDYAPALPLLERHPNLVVLRTFSKAWGLAGLRVGYGVMHPDRAAWLHRVRLPFNVPSLGMAVARAALADRDWVMHAARKACAAREKLAAAVEGRGLAVAPSNGNFIMVRAPADGAGLQRRILEAGVFVRALPEYGLPDHLRVTVGTPAMQRVFLAALDASL